MAVSANSILMTFTAADQLSPVAKQIVAQLQAVEQATGKADAELQRLGLSTKTNVQTLQTHAQTLTQVSTATQKTGQAARQAGDDAERGFGMFGRGIASSIFNFSLLAGATIETGHIVGEFLTGSVDKARALEEEVGKIAALNPRMNADQLFDQLRSLEAESGVLSNKLAAVFSIAAQAGGGGSQQQTLDLTRQLSLGAQGTRQDPAQWAQSALAAMNAYGSGVQNVAHIQDVMTEALQKSAGQGQVFTQNLDRLTATASQSNLSFEGLTAAFETVAQHGGDATKNVMGLNQIIASFETDKTKQKLNDLGIATQDEAGNARDLAAIWTELAAKLATVSPATQQSILTSIIPDKRSVSEFQILLSNMGQFNTLLTQTKTETGATAKAIDEFGKSNEGLTARIDAQKQSLQEWLGTVIDVQRHFAGLLAIVTQNETPEKIKQQSQFPQQPDWLIADMTNQNKEAAAQAAGMTQQQLGAQQQLQEQYRQTSAIVKQASAEYNQNTGEVQKNAGAMAAAAQAAEVWASWNGKVLASSSGLTPSIAGVSSAINQLYQDSQRLLQGNAFGGFGSEQEQNIANIAEALQTADTRLQALKSEPIPSGQSILGALVFGGAKSAIDATTNSVRSLQAQLKEAAAQTPEGIQAQNTFDEFMQQNAFAQTTTAQQKQLTDATNAYNASIKSLQDQLRALQQEEQPTSTSALGVAYRKLEADTKALDDATAKYDADLRALNETKYQAQQAEAQALDQPQRNLTGLQSTQTDNQAVQNKLLSDLNDQLYEAQQKVTQAQNAETAALAPLKTALDNAATATRNLQASQQAGDAEFQKAERYVQNQIAVLQELAYQTLTPLHKEIEKYTEELYQVNLAEQQALRPIEDAIYAQSAALRDAQAAAQAVADKYANELNPLQAEYNALQREAQQAQNADTLHKEAVSVENLAARLADAKKGSAEYLQLQQQLATAQTTQGRDKAMFGLQDQIAAITAERDKALQAAQKEVERQQKVLDQLNQQQQAITHKYDLEKRGIQDTLDAKQHEYDLDNQHYQDDEAYYQHQLTNIQQDQAAYDLSMQDKIDKAKQVESNAQNAYDIEKANQDKLVAAAAAAVTTLQNTIGWYNQQFKGQDANFATAVKDAQTAVDQIKAYYEGPDGIITLLDKKITTQQHDATTYEQSLKDQVASDDRHYKDLKKPIDDMITLLGNQITKVQDTATETETAANRAITAEKAKQTALLNTLAIINAIENLIKSGGTYDPQKLADFYKQAGIRDPNTIPGTPVTEAPPPPEHKPGEPVHVPGISGQSVGFPFGSTTRLPIRQPAGVSGHSVGAPNIIFQISTAHDLSQQSTWDRFGEMAANGIQRAMGRYGVGLSWEPR